MNGGVCCSTYQVGMFSSIDWWVNVWNPDWRGFMVWFEENYSARSWISQKSGRTLWNCLKSLVQRKTRAALDSREKTTTPPDTIPRARPSSTTRPSRHCPERRKILNDQRTIPSRKKGTVTSRPRRNKKRKKISTRKIKIKKREKNFNVKIKIKREKISTWKSK